jgi:hypothetical protein
MRNADDDRYAERSPAVLNRRKFLVAGEDIDKPFDRVVKKDVRYRFVIDLAKRK